MKNVKIEAGVVLVPCLVLAGGRLCSAIKADPQQVQLDSAKVILWKRVDWSTTTLRDLGNSYQHMQQI